MYIDYFYYGQNFNLHGFFLNTFFLNKIHFTNIMDLKKL